MAKFKTRGGKTVVIGIEAIGINDPLLGSGMAQGGKRSRKRERKAERKKKTKQMERALRNSPGRGGPGARSYFDPSRPLRYQDSRSAFKRKAR